MLILRNLIKLRDLGIKPGTRTVPAADVSVRIGETFADVYFLGLGIFQNVVASRLFDRFLSSQFDLATRTKAMSPAEKFAHFFQNGDFSILLELAPFVLTLILMIYVLYSYWWWICLVRTRTSVRDFLLPLSFGFCEFGQINYIDSIPQWALFVGLFCLVATFALTNSYRRLIETRFEFQILGVNEVHRNERIRNVVCRWHTAVFLAAVSGVVVGISGWIFPTFLGYVGVLVSVATVVLLAFCLGIYGFYERRFLRGLGELDLLQADVHRIPHQ